MNIDFAEAVAIAGEESYGLTPSGLDVLFGIFDHLSDGGKIEDYPIMSGPEVIAILGMAYVEARDAVLERTDNY